MQPTKIQMISLLQWIKNIEPNSVHESNFTNCLFHISSLDVFDNIDSMSFVDCYVQPTDSFQSYTLEEFKKRKANV